MRIGIITYHFARNYGAILQCFALQSFLQSKGHNVEVINYMTEKQEHNNSLHHKREDPIQNLVVNIALLPFEKKRRLKEKRFVEFERKMLRLSPRFRSINEFASYVNDKGFDLLISGSDQVFNPKIEDFDCAFLLPFETSAKKASFAASFGNSTLEDVLKFRQDFCGFDYLCVREKTDAPIAIELCQTKPVTIDDPVFLLGRNEWACIESEKAAPVSEGFVLGYYINKETSSRYLKLTKAVAEELGLPMIVINVRFGVESFRSGMVTDAGPSEFLSLISAASFVCTDSFHGTAFSLIYGKPFVSFEPKAKSNDWRKRDLLQKVGELRRSIPADQESAMSEILEVASSNIRNAEEALKGIQSAQEMYLRTITDVVEGD